MTNVPQPVLGPTGYVIPSEQAILAGVIADFQAAYGGNLNLSISNTSSLSTPDGQLVSSFAAIIADCYAQIMAVVSQCDPQYAQGRMQDSIGNIYYMTRLPAQGTTVSATCLGLAGTAIPSGVPVAVDAGGNLYTCSGGTIPAGGSLAMTFTNQVPGATAFTGPLVITQTIPGWDSVIGATQQVLGQPIETQQAFEVRRAASVAVNAQNSVQAIKGAVLALQPPNNPVSVYVADNPTNAAVVTGGITLPPNSLYVAAYGGSAGAIANAIWTKKSLGCSYAPSAIFVGGVSGTTLTLSSVTSGVVAVGQTLQSSAGLPLTSSGGVPITITVGSGLSWTLSASPGTISGGTTLWSGTTVTVYDTSYAATPPAYNVTFTVPVVVPVNIQVTLAAVRNPPSNALALLLATNGLLAAFAGTDGGVPVAQIGATVYGSRFYSTIAGLMPLGTTILSVLVGTGSPTGNSAPMNINQIPALGNITLVLA